MNYIDDCELKSEIEEICKMKSGCERKLHGNLDNFET